MRTLPGTLGGTAAVVVLGFVLGHYGSHKTAASPVPLDRQASVAAFTVSYPGSWHVVSPPTTPLTQLSDALALAADGAQRGRLVIGIQQIGVPSALPPRLAAALPRSTAPQVVSLGGRRFYRFLNLTPQGQQMAESVYSLPTTSGTVTAVCSAPAFTVPFTSVCERILSTIRLTTAKVVSMNADPGYAFALNRILGPLNQARHAAGPGLRSAHVSRRVRAASALAAAHAQAAAATRRISAGSVGAANRALAAALRLNAGAYTALARAAARGDVPAYERAEAALASARSGLDAVFIQLRQIGYVIH